MMDILKSSSSSEKKGGDCVYSRVVRKGKSARKTIHDCYLNCMRNRSDRMDCDMGYVEIVSIWTVESSGNMQ